MAGVTNTGNLAKLLQEGVNHFWGLGYKDHPLELTDIFDEEMSEKAYEEDVMVVGTGLMPVKAEGAAVSYDSVRQGYVQRYNHLTYAMGLQFTYEMMADKQYKVGLEQARTLGRSARITQETIAANILNRAFNSSYTYADGLELCSTLHPNVSGGTFSNELATAADLSQASLEQASIDIGKFEDDRGLPLAARATKLIVPIDLWHEASRILKTEKEVNSANNAINTVKSELGLDLCVNHYLTDTDAFFLKTDVPHGLKRIIREKVGAPVRENDFDTRNMKFAVFFRESYGVTDPRGLFASPGA